MPDGRLVRLPKAAGERAAEGLRAGGRAVRGIALGLEFGLGLVPVRVRVRVRARVRVRVRVANRG